MYCVRCTVPNKTNRTPNINNYPKSCSRLLFPSGVSHKFRTLLRQFKTPMRPILPSTYTESLRPPQPKLLNCKIGALALKLAHHRFAYKLSRWHCESLSLKKHCSKLLEREFCCLSILNFISHAVCDCDCQVPVEIAGRWTRHIAKPSFSGNVGGNSAKSLVKISNNFVL